MRQLLTVGTLAAVLISVISLSAGKAIGHSAGCEIDSQVIRSDKVVKIERKDSLHFITLANGQKLTTQERVEFVISAKDNYPANRYPFVVESHCKGSYRLLYAIHFSDIENFKKYNSENLFPFLWIDASNIRAIRKLSNDRYFVDFYGTSPTSISNWNVPSEGKPDEVFTIEVDATRFRFPQLDGQYAGPIFNGFVQGNYMASEDAVSISVPQITISFPSKEAAEKYFKAK